MLPEVDLQRLEHLRLLLCEALGKEDWPRIGEIDSLIRLGLQRLRAEGELSAPLVAALAPLKALHGQALQACALECQRVSGLLRSHTEHGEGRRAYSLLESVQGEG